MSQATKQLGPSAVNPLDSYKKIAHRLEIADPRGACRP
jgi:hypothetical protein